MTDAERRLWSRIRCRKLGVLFNRQKIIGNYIVDFYSHAAKLVIEIDGGQHFVNGAAQRDRERDQALRASGLHVVSYHNGQVMAEIESVVEDLVNTINKQLQDGH